MAAAAAAAAAPTCSDSAVDWDVLDSISRQLHVLHGLS
jgi:hypothetical protein